MPKVIELVPPRFGEDQVEEKIVCIRPHRERIFRVEPEWYHDKLVFHNYGQGGAGWTFLFGCVHESIRQFEQQMSSRRTQSIGVIGAGCYGLLTAILLARKGYSVRIIAQEKLNLSSYKAAGFFFPRHRKCSTEQEKAIFKALGIESYKTYLQIAQRVHPLIKKGAYLLPAYFGLDIDPGFDPYIAEGIISTAEEVSINFGGTKIYQAQKYQTIFMNATELMEELYRHIVELAIPIEQIQVDAFSDIPESIIFNCAGLGAKKLADDKRIVPVQGHLITLKNQADLSALQYMVNVKITMTTPQGTPRDELIYYAPKGSGIVGITFLRGQDSLTANQHEFERLLERCQLFFGE